jgi:hypothetical protein
MAGAAATQSPTDIVIVRERVADAAPAGGPDQSGTGHVRTTHIGTRAKRFMRPVCRPRETSECVETAQYVHRISLRDPPGQIAGEIAND